MCELIEKDGKMFKLVPVELEEREDVKVVVNGWNVTEFEKWYDSDYCLEAVKQDGYALRYVKDQTLEFPIFF